MLPRLAASSDRRYSATRENMLRRVDEVLFTPGAWFAIDVENRRVPGVFIADIDQAVAMIGRGKVSAFVGRLRPGFHVIDIDVDDGRGHAVTESLAAQCREAGWWHLVRPSGGGDGRHHLFVHSDGRLHDLEQAVAMLQRSYRVARSKIDLRTTVRPLSSPHRGGTHPAPLGDLRRACSTLLAVTERMPAPPASRRRASTTSSPQGSRPRRAYRPEKPHQPACQRPRAPLPAKWAVYLATGRLPAWNRAHDPHVDASPSTYELMCTAAMLRAGYDHDEAWAAIANAHPDAMNHARRESQQRWTTHVWNAAARADEAFVPTPQVDEAVWAATQQARQRVRTTAWFLPVRQRPVFLLVAYTVLRRMEATSSLRVPVPERDLVLDTGISDRRTIRAALRHLDGSAGTLHRDALELRDKTSSSYEFSIPAALGGVSEIPPPSFHTPLRSTLPSHLTASHWLTLHSLHPTHALTAPQLCPLTQRTPSPTSVPAAHLVRSQQQLLTDLQALGLAVCDETGAWTRPQDLPGVALARHDDYEQLHTQVEAERRHWRTGGHSEWLRQRTQALTATRARARTWWTQLDPTERCRRLAQLGQDFDESSVQAQHDLKRRLSERDRHVGIDPLARRKAWWQALSPVEQNDRRQARLERWHRLPQPEQVAHARMWERERRDLRTRQQENDHE